jgi:hypothetical protein
MATDGSEGSGLSVAQSALYAGGLASLIYASYQAGKTADAPEDATFDWVLDSGTKNHCDDCQSNADGGPYTTDELPGYPADGSQQCAGNCRCTIEAAT